MHGSFRNLAALVDGVSSGDPASGAPLTLSDKAASKSHHSIDSNGKLSRCEPATSTVRARSTADRVLPLSSVQCAVAS